METIMIKAILLLTLIAAGYLLKQLHILKPGDASVVSRIMIYLTLPAALISGFHNFQPVPQFLLLIPLTFICNVLLVIAGLLITRKKSPEIRSLYALQLSSYNIGAFVLPFVQSFMPAEGIVGAALFDIGNCPMNCGISYAIVTASVSKRKISCTFVLRALLRSPPFVTYSIMLLVSLLHIRLPAMVFTLAGSIGSANTLLAMLMIGLLLEFRISPSHRSLVLHILGLRYACNLLIALAICLSPLPLLLRQVAVLCVLSPIPSMSLIYSRKCGCDDAACGLLSSLSLLISLPLAFLSTLFLQP